MPAAAPSSWRSAPALEPTEWTLIGAERGDEVQNGVLQRLDTTAFAEGPYTLRLTVNRGDGPKVATMPVTIDNTPPTIVVTEPKPDRLYVMEEDEQINVNALANDNMTIGRVVFMIDGKGFGDSTVSPYNQRWEITMRDINSAAGGTALAGLHQRRPRHPTRHRWRPIADGFQAIVTNGGVYLEGHEIKVVAYDAAGNSDRKRTDSRLCETRKRSDRSRRTSMPTHLVTNDDGITCAGLLALKQAAGADWRGDGAGAGAQLERHQPRQDHAQAVAHSRR